MPTVIVSQDSQSNLQLSGPDVGFRIPLNGQEQINFQGDGSANIPNPLVTLGCVASQYLQVQQRDSQTCVVTFLPNVVLPSGNTLCDVTINLGTTGLDPTIVIDNP